RLQLHASLEAGACGPVRADRGVSGRRLHARPLRRADAVQGDGAVLEDDGVERLRESDRSDADEREAPVGAGRRAIGMCPGGCGERDERQQEAPADESAHHGCPTAARLRASMKERIRVRPAMLALGLASAAPESWVRPAAIPARGLLARERGATSRYRPDEMAILMGTPPGAAPTSLLQSRGR